MRYLLYIVSNRICNSNSNEYKKTIRLLFVYVFGTLERDTAKMLCVDFSFEKEKLITVIHNNKLSIHMYVYEREKKDKATTGFMEIMMQYRQ